MSRTCCAPATITCPARAFPYTTNLPLARAVEDDVLLVHTWEGEPLPQEHGGPCRMITPKLYAWKGTKWIRKIEFLAGNKRGFWEERGYSDTAEPGSMTVFGDLDDVSSPSEDLRVRCSRQRSAADAGDAAVAAPSLTDKAYVYEPKVDGIRAIVEVLPGTARRACGSGRATATRRRRSFPTSARRSARG